MVFHNTRFADVELVTGSEYLGTSNTGTENALFARFRLDFIRRLLESIHDGRMPFIKNKKLFSASCRKQNHGYDECAITSIVIGACRESTFFL